MRPAPSAFAIAADLPRVGPEPDESLALVLDRIEAAIRARWNDGLIARDPDGVFTSVLGAEHVERLLRTPAAESRPVIERGHPRHTPIGMLAQLLHLTPTEQDLLALLLACEIDPRCARLVCYLGGNQSPFRVTVDLVLDIVYRARDARSVAAAAALHRDLGPGGWLRRLGFIQLQGGAEQVSLAQSVRLHPRVTAWLLGQTRLDEALSAKARLHEARDPEGEHDEATIARVVAGLRAPGQLVLVEGPLQSGREMLLRFAAARLGRRLLVVDGRRLSAAEVAAAFREASLQSAILAFRDARDLLDGEALAAWKSCLEAWPASVALMGTGRAASLTPIVRGVRPTVDVVLDVPDHGERLRLWQAHLGAGALSDLDLRRVAAGYNLGIGGIVAASQDALEAARRDGVAPTPRHVARAVRDLFDADLATVADHVQVRQRWSDLVIPEDVEASLKGIIERLRYRCDVLGGWGFARKTGKGLGLTGLFLGQPGTGKSMSAGLIAAELGLELYVVNLARVTSKWLGETEKNLARAFDAAEAGHVVLLFDEADTILGKRTSDVKSANDRNANLETNFILSRLEQFAGIAFFTSNLRSAIDPAVMRRMSATIEFPFPDTKIRAELWRRMIPSEAPVAGDIDWKTLAARYQVAGGFIRNIVLRAAFLARSQDAAIGMKHLEDAAGLEYLEHGSLIGRGRLT